jgi:branched-subunit amino acid transport protein
MTWGLVFAVGAAAYAFKVLGLVVIGDRTLPPVVERCLTLIPAALVAAIIVKDTFTIGHDIELDARAAGVAAAAVAAWRKVPLAAVIIIGAAVTALVRAIS